MSNSVSQFPAVQQAHRDHGDWSISVSYKDSGHNCITLIGYSAEFLSGKGRHGWKGQVCSEVEMIASAQPSSKSIKQSLVLQWPHILPHSIYI